MDDMLPEQSPPNVVAINPVRAFLLNDNNAGKVYLAFGTSAVEAANTLGGDIDRFGVGGEYDLVKPICVSGWWPYFTNNPSRHADK